VEAAPAVLLGFAVLARLPDEPARAMLSGGEGLGIAAAIRLLFDVRVLALSAAYLGSATAGLAITILLREILRRAGLSAGSAGFATAVPYVVGGVGMLVWAHVSDLMNEYRWNLVLSSGTAAFGCLIVAASGGSYGMVAGLSLIMIGTYTMRTQLFVLPPEFLTGPALAAGIAWVNALGNLGGFFGPTMVGSLLSADGFETTMYALAAVCLAGGTIGALAVRSEPAATVR